MRLRSVVAGAALVALAASLLTAGPAAQAQQSGFRISGRNLLDANGNVFVMRGTSHPHVWFQQETASYAEIAGLGANTVRVVLGSGHRGWGISTASDVANVVNLCKQNRLICMLEVHDTTGFGEQSGAATLDQAVTYWDSIRSALIGQEAYILINIGNEPIGNNNPGQWTDATVNAVRRMRSLGFTHTLVVDAPNWGQDWTNTMRNNAQTVWNADPQRNTLFSIHMYEVYGTASAITSYFDAFAQMGLPLIVGEFGNMHNGQNVDEDTIMAEAQARGIGWLAWSYSGNSDGLLDQVINFNPNQLTAWGQRVFTGPNGIQQTARCATVFSGCGPGGGGGTPPAAPTGLTVTGTTPSSVSLSWSPSAGATQYQVQRASGACSASSSFSQVGTTSGTAFTNTGLAAGTSYCYRVTASNASGTSAPSSAVTATTASSGGGGGCSAVPTVQSQWQNGYVVQPVTVTNTGTSPVSGWRVTFTLPSGHAIVGSWNATLSGTSGTITATNMSYNGNLGAGASTSFGFQVSRPNGNTQTPSAFSCAAS